MGFLESDDVGIRSLVCLHKLLMHPISNTHYFVHPRTFTHLCFQTIKLLSSQPGLLELCYSRAIEAVRKSSTSSVDGHGRARALESSIELAFAVSSTSSKSPEREAETLVKMLKEIAEVSNAKGDDYVDGNFIQHVLVRLRGGAYFLRLGVDFGLTYFPRMLIIPQKTPIDNAPSSLPFFRHFCRTG